MPKQTLTWAMLCEFAKEAGLENPRTWKFRGSIPDSSKWKLARVARKRRIILTDADFDALIPRPESSAA